MFICDINQLVAAPLLHPLVFLPRTFSLLGRGEVIQVCVRVRRFVSDVVVDSGGGQLFASSSFSSGQYLRSHFEESCFHPC